MKTMETGNAVRDRRHLFAWLIAVAMAVGLTFVFWHDLWAGGGLIGGDTYTYFYPQKVYFAERLAAGEFPLWNSLAGHGYPLIAESQTGALYPFNLVAYRWFDVATAYNVVQISHYALAFVFTWMYARRFGLSSRGSLFAALVFVYAWFPFRISLEWAAVTGAWLPAALWSSESLIQTRFWRYAILLAGVLGIQMLGGHFNLAFITQLLLAIYIPGRLWFAKRQAEPSTDRSRLLFLSAAGIACGFGLAAVQILPTWELKQQSQRAEVGGELDPGQGHTPVACWSQCVAPWMWYGVGGDINEHLPAGSSKTNDVEAHLYFGLFPLGLLLFGLFGRSVFGERGLLLWLVIGVAALLYTPGWLVPVTQHLPGFSFFEGPGRYSIVTTFAVAMIAAAVLDRWLKSSRPVLREVLFAVAMIGTTADLLWVAGTVSNVLIVPSPPLKELENSKLREILRSAPEPVRLFCRGPNLPTLTGVSSTPAWFGLGPAAYYDPKIAMPEPLPYDVAPTLAQIEWLRQAGVTHVLSFAKLDETQWPATLIWSGRDAVLNRAWARREPLFLYKLNGSRGRAFWESSKNKGEIRFDESGANFVRLTAESQNGGRLVLTELAYPGWEVVVDGEPAISHVVGGAYRAVDVPSGKHAIEWRYRPWSILWGLVISILAMIVLAAVAHIRFWHPRKTSSAE